MNYSGDAAEQVVRMSLNGIEVAAKISGKAAERLAVLLYAVLKDQKKTRGKIRLTNMLKSGKELKVFAVKDSDLQKFCEEAKKYGVLYCVLKDRNANDGLTDIMVRAEDASKINRIFERFNLATVDMAHLFSLGAGAVPYMEELTDCDDPELRSRAIAFLRAWTLEQAGDFREFTWINHHAQQIIANWQEETP